jgi:hypothetical protein
VPATEFLPVRSPPARFFQYRLTLAGDGLVTPVIQEVEIAYQLPNLPPVVSAVRVTPGDASNPDTRPRRSISWDATDPNDDDLRHRVQFRSAGGIGEDGWITIKDRLEEQAFDWDTRTVADGRYDIRITSSDADANAEGSGLTASRISDPVLVDNTPPAIGDLKITPLAEPRGAVEVRCTVVDRGSTVERLEYALDGLDRWQLVLPSDMIADSPREEYVFVLRRARGPGQLALRATDAIGNQSFVSVPTPAGEAVGQEP